MSFLEIIVLAVVQGCTEFIPVSSSGHLVIIRELMGWSDECGIFVDVTLHGASLLAIFIYFFKEWWSMLLGLVQWKNEKYKPQRIEFFLLVLATVPVVIFGPWLEAIMDVVRNGKVVGVSMVLTAVWFFVTEKWHRAWKERLGAGTALTMGIAQVFAVLPGVSRSGVTISTGLLCGQRHVRAARFSFFMVAPTIVGATILELGKISAENLQSLLAPVAVGFVVCFVVSLISIYFCLRIFKKHSLVGFGVYLLVLGAVLLVLQ